MISSNLPKDQKNSRPQSCQAKKGPIELSHNLLREKLKKEKEEKEAKQAQKYHQAKALKREKPKVPSLVQSDAQRELNIKHIAIESLVDRKVKISSTATKIQQQPLVVDEIRKQREYTSINKPADKMDYGDMLEKKDSNKFTDMIKRDLLITPGHVDFGKLKYGTSYEKAIVVKNEDVVPQRIHVYPTQLKHVTVKQKETGPLAMGVAKYVIITVDARKENIGPINCEFKIKSKLGIYQVQISGEIVDGMGGESERFKITSDLAPFKIEDGDPSKTTDIIDYKLPEQDTSFPKLEYDKSMKLDVKTNVMDKVSNKSSRFELENA